MEFSPEEKARRDGLFDALPDPFALNELVERYHYKCIDLGVVSDRRRRHSHARVARMIHSERCFLSATA
jgi:hypothetical protein